MNAVSTRRTPSAALNPAPAFRWWRHALFALVALAGPTLLFLHPPFGQDPAYHRFADRRVWGEIPNLFDVASNLPFLFVGVAGLLFFRRHDVGSQRRAWLTFFAGVSLVAFGSSFYHLAPADNTLVWDRLPMVVAFMALFSALLGETFSERLGRAVLLPALLLGAGSVCWWRLFDDLRPYFAVQLLCLLGVTSLLVLFPRADARRGYLLAGLACYAFAVAAEQLDRPIFAGTHQLISGHTLKHLLAAAGCAAVLSMLRARPGARN